MAQHRFILQRGLTNEWLDFDVELQNVSITMGSNKAPLISCSIEPEQQRIFGSDGNLMFQNWSSMLWYELDNQIITGGILTNSEFNDQRMDLTFEGFLRYPEGIPYTGMFSQTEVDVLDVYRHLWEYLQDHPDGDLGLTLPNTKSGTLLGTERDTVTDEEGNEQPGELIPYELMWWNITDIGQEMESLRKLGPFEVEEVHQWNDSNKQSIRHSLNFGVPRLGRARSDLRFVQGENITDHLPLNLDGDIFANEVHGVGMGDGEELHHRMISERNGRFRRVHTYTDRTVDSDKRLDTLARDALQARKDVTRIAQIEVDAHHPNAPFGSYRSGDDILLEAEIPWIGDVEIWHKITGYTFNPLENRRVLIDLEPALLHRYGGQVS